MPAMETGLDRLPRLARLVPRLAASRVGLLAHPASVDRRLRHARDVLAEHGIAPRIVFGPEHGYGGEAQDMIGVADAKDAHGAPVRSLYGERFADLSPRAEDLAQIDVLVIDLQDVGARYYTFVWTAVLALRACAAAGVELIVLDRPNPIGGDPSCIEGPTLDERFRSFVGLESIPVRHSLTLGEIVAYRAHVEKLDVTVVAASGLARDAHAPAWDRPFVMPSPNMPAYETALVYPGGCLLEGTNLSDGRGTTRPFEITGAPWLDGRRLAGDLDALALPGVLARALTFRPTFHKHQGKTCGGVQLHVTDARAFRPVATYLALVALAHHQRPGAFRFRTERYEFVDGIPAFDLLTGCAHAREAIVAGESPADVAALARATPDDVALVETAREAARSRTT
jgi:uncharacterized protein YbbC (DUF1343 family)